MEDQRVEKKLKVEGCFINSASEPGATPVPELPPEVIQYMLELCGSLKLVKVCRLVSKSWNEISCTVLKKLSVVVIEEAEEDKLEEFKLFLLDRTLGVSPEFPNPFQNYNVNVGPDFPPDITRFIRYPNVKINVLAITRYPTMSAREFTALLGSVKPFVRILSIRGCCEGSEELLLNPNIIKGWSFLTSLTFHDDDNPDVPEDFIRFIQAIIQENPSLHELNLYAKVEIVQVCLVTESTQGIGSLISLFVDICDLNEDPASSIACLREISTLEAPNLKHITFHVKFFQTVHAELKQTVLTIAERQSQVLELLATNFNILTGLKRIPNFPQLQQLSFNLYHYKNFKNTFSGEHFPSLSTLQVIPKFKEILQLCEAQSVQQNFLLNKLDVCYRVRFETLGTATIWPVLSRHFPCVTKISVSFQSIECDEDYSRGILRAIGKFFPQLESLEFCSNTPMTLLDIPQLETFTERGWALNDITDDPILGLKNLMSLKLGNRVSLDRDFIRFGLLRMENWRSLSFPWKEEALESDDIITYLGFLTHITDIRITCESLNTFYELRMIAEETTNVSIERAKEVQQG